jgi:hypothetical protein|nr:MAG TPA: hypothetical protein [Caudoviricetes sp.]
MRKYLLDLVLVMILAAMLSALLVQVISPTATLMLSPLGTLLAEIIRKQAVIACNCKLRGVAIIPFWKTLRPEDVFVYKFIASLQFGVVIFTCFGVGSVWIYEHFTDTSSIPIAAVLVSLALMWIANRE